MVWSVFMVSIRTASNMAGLEFGNGCMQSIAIWHTAQLHRLLILEHLAGLHLGVHQLQLQSIV